LYNELYNYFATVIIKRLNNLMKSRDESEYFVVFSGIFDLLGMEQSLNSFDYKTKRWIELNERDFYKGIFNELINLRYLNVEQEIEGNYIYSVDVNENFKFKLFPYFVEEELEDTNEYNVGRRGYAGKLRDDQSIRSNGSVILIFDINPIATLSSASDSEVLTSTISKDSLKKDILDEPTNPWFKEFGSLILNDSLHPHTLNIIDRINLLLQIKLKIEREINDLISLYKLPLFFFQGECNADSIKKNYNLFRTVSNEKLQKNSMNFYKNVVQSLNLHLLPSSVSENVFLNILKEKSLHESDMYNYRELTWEKVYEVLNDKPSTDFNNISFQVDNNTTIEAINKKKNKFDLLFINKNSLNNIFIKIDGEITENPNVFVHYYFNDFSKRKDTNSISDLLTITIDNRDYKSLTLIINKNKNRLSSPLYTAKILFLKLSDYSIISPNVDVSNIDWLDGIYPTVIIDKEIENLSELDYSFKKLDEEGNNQQVTVNLKDKEEIQDLPGEAKYNIYLENNIVTSFYVKQKEEDIKLSRFKHLVHFLVQKSNNVNELNKILDSISFNQEKYDGFYYENEFIGYSAEDEFKELLKEVGLDSINALYDLILKNKTDVITSLPYEEESDKEPPWNDSNIDIRNLLSVRYQVLAAFEDIYLNDAESNTKKLNKFHKKSKEYLKRYSELVNEHPQLVKIDCIEVDDVRLFTPFSPVNLAFLTDLWELAISSVAEDELALLKKNVLRQIDNYETFKHIKSDTDWFISRKSPAFGWLLYTRENKSIDFLDEKYLDKLVDTKINQLERLYHSVFNKDGQTLHIAVINPGDASYILKGVSSFIKDKIETESKLPKFHISLIFKNEESLSRYTAFDKLFDTEGYKNKTIVSNLSYKKITMDDSLANKNNFYHLIFIKDIFDTNKTSPKNMHGFENEYYDTFFANGFQCHPLKKAIKDDSQQTLKHIDYVSFNNYNSLSEINNFSRMVYNSVNKYFVQAFQTQFETNEHPLRRVRVSLEDIPYEQFNKGFLVTFLDKEIDVDIFNDKKLKEARKPFLLDYTDFEETIGFNAHRFFTITNQKGPFKEIFKMALKEETSKSDLNDKQIERLFDEINLLNGFWVLRILDSENDSIIKGMLGTVAASIFMRNSLKEDPNNWHFIISLEEIMGATKNKGFNGLKQKYADDSQLYSDDLAIISFPKNITTNDVININLTLIEIKNSSNVEYVKKGFNQLRDTQKLLKDIYVNVPAKIKSLRMKDIITWLIYHNKKHQIFNSGFTQEVDNLRFEEDLHRLILRINSSDVDLNVNEGVLVNINDNIDSIERLEAVSPNYIYIKYKEYVDLLLEQGDVNE
jgi:hypothetical protein